MFYNQPLSQLYTLHYILKKTTQSLLKPLKIVEFEGIFSQLSSSTLSLKVDKELVYGINTIDIREQVLPCINKVPFIIEQLSYDTLKKAEKLRDDTFGNIEDIEKNLLRASLDKELHKQSLKQNDITTLSYWVARDKVSKKVIGLTGLYTEIYDEENCWLGWFCVDKTYRGKGLGKRLLQFAEEQAKSLKKETMHIYTYNSKKYARAIEMYKQFGYSEYAVKNTKYKRDLYFKKEIDNIKRLEK